MMESERTMLLGGWGDTGITRDQLMSMKDWESDPILVRALERVRAILARLKIAEQDLTLEIAARLVERKGSVMPDGRGLEAVLEAGVEWVCDLERLAEVQAYISPEEWDKLAPLPPAPERRPNKSVGNQLAKRGGPVAAIIEAAWTAGPKEPKVKVRQVKS